MLQVVLATARPEAWPSFVKALLSDPEVQLKKVASGAAAIEAVRATPPHLVIIDASLPDTSPPELVQELLMVNALVNTAVVSPLAEEEFHEASEGFGILSRLSLKPGAPEAHELLRKLRLVLGEP
jgi:DNA-binding response OmpR family regulator